VTFTTTTSGWGNYPKEEAQILMPYSSASLRAVVTQERSLIARGMGRSYGDSANATKILQTSYCDHLIEFDEKMGRITAEAGITLREILKVIMQSGWFLSVTPGTSYVTLGGAIASDVHGKNHHNAGTFANHVKSIRMVLGTGEVVTASEAENTDLFRATCGGMGLTGIIVSATIQLISVRSSFINQKTVKADCIEDACEAFEDNSSSTYSVAWIDCLAKGDSLGRSVLRLGEHAENGGLEMDIKDPISVPFNAPSILLNRMTMKTFNGAYWNMAKHNHIQTVLLMPYFYPLDAIGNWNKLYGKSGFLQFQCVIPKEDGIANMRKLLKEIVESGEASLLAVLKQFGKANNNLLSFPTEGYTLALDFKLTASSISTLYKLEDLIAEMGGRVYLTKDAVMKEATFKSTYPNWEEFELVRERYGAIGKFSSSQSKRLGLA
jgi:decaprenylphospho-beta-D-ribofuranose 2-oxidase